MLNLALVSMLTFGYYEELPSVNFDDSKNFVIVKRTGVFRRKVYVEVPVATIESNANIVKKTTVETTIVERPSNKVLEIVTEKPIFPRLNSAVRNIVTPKVVNSKEIIIEENPNELVFEKKTTITHSDNQKTTTTETTTTTNSDIYVEQRRSLFGRTRYRIFR